MGSEWIEANILVQQASSDESLDLARGYAAPYRTPVGCLLAIEWKIGRKEWHKSDFIPSILIDETNIYGTEHKPCEDIPLPNLNLSKLTTFACSPLWHCRRPALDRYAFR